MPLNKIIEIVDLLNIPQSWLSSPATILTNLVIPFFVIWYAVYFFLKEMRIFGYKEGVYAILGLLVSFVLVISLELGVIGGVLGVIVIAFLLKRTNIIIKLLIVGGFLILVFLIIPRLL